MSEEAFVPEELYANSEVFNVEHKVRLQDLETTIRKRQKDQDLFRDEYLVG